MTRALLLSLLLHVGAVAVVIRHPSPVPPRAARRPMSVALLAIPGGGTAKASSLAPGGLAGVPRPRRKGRARTVQPQPLVEPSAPAGVAGEAHTEVEVEGPVGDGAGPEGMGELGPGELSALVQQRVQAMANLMCGRRWTKTQTVVFRVDERGYVADHEHRSELDQILHMAEPFPPGGPYTVTVEY